jgi:phospholipid/cholesterol/gamma-HCH transport system substrate-binding protein
VPVGRVESVKVERSSLVTVGFSVDESVDLTSSTTATVRYKNLVGDRIMDLAPGIRPGRALRAGESISAENAEPALDLDALLNGFKPLFVGLSPTQINALSDQLVQVLQGQAGAATRLVSTLSSFTNTIATREQVISRVVRNLNTVLGALDAKGDSVGTIIDQLTLVVEELSSKSSDVIVASRRIEAMSSETAALVRQARPPLRSDLADLRTVATTLDANSATLQQVLTNWPRHYKALLRAGSHGNFLNFYLCEVRLRFSPEGASNPVQTPWLRSEAKRCQP